MFRKGILAFLAVLAIALLLSNPGLNQFKEYTHYLVCPHGTTDQTQPLYRSANYYFFSTYGGTVPCLNSQQKNIHYIGIAGYFFELRRADDMH